MFLADSEALCMYPCLFNFFLNSKLSSEKIKQLFINFHTFDFRPQYLPKYVNMGDYKSNDFFLGCVRLFTKYQLHKLNANGKKQFLRRTIFPYFVEIPPYPQH